MCATLAVACVALIPFVLSLPRAARDSGHVDPCAAALRGPLTATKLRCQLGRPVQTQVTQVQGQRLVCDTYQSIRQRWQVQLCEIKG